MKRRERLGLDVFQSESTRRGPLLQAVVFSILQPRCIHQQTQRVSVERFGSDFQVNTVRCDPSDYRNGH
jgi:hypothetical protein